MSWQAFLLGDLYQIGSSKRILKSDWQAEGVPFYRGREITKLSINGFVDNELFITEEHYSDLIRKYGAPNEGDIMITAIGTIGNSYIVRKKDRFYFKDASVLWLKRISDISSHYVNLWLQSLHFFEQLESGNGATVDTLSIQKLQSVKISVPPTQEQQRIVVILDQAFAGIAKARANAEQNLQNARDLFESHVQSVFSVRGEFVEPPHTSTSSGRTGWIDTTIGECTKFIDYRGKTPIKTEFGTSLITAKNVKMGYIQDEPREYVSPEIYDEWMTRGIPRKGDVLFTTEAPLANVAQLGTDEKVVFAQRIIIMQPDKVKLDQKFLKFLLMSAPIQSRIHEKATGATAQGIKASLLKTIKISFPNTIAEQIKIAEQLESLDEETQRLEALYQRKIACLDELKKSLLQRAFAGELIADIQPSNIILLPTKKPMSSTDVHTGILALAYQKHEDRGNVVNFGHVKAEKIAHMVEAMLSIDLGRAPFKDAAGPNDYPHLKSVESRARKAGYFDFKQVNIGAYRVTKLNKFDEITDKTRTFLAEEMAAIDKLLELMLPMDTQQAEIFCTVYAAWNNLLLDGMQPTDEAIVYEARENWHPDKLKIPREKFFAAITWMRDKQIVPKGTGKKVLARNTK